MARHPAADGTFVYGDGGIQNVQLPYPRVSNLGVPAAVEDQPVVLAIEYLIAFVPAGPFAALRQRGGGASRRGRQTPLQERLEHGAEALGRFQHRLVPPAPRAPQPPPRASPR